MSKIERPQRLPKESWCVPTPASTPATLLLPPCSQIQGSSRRISGFRQGHLVESLCWPRGRSGHIYCSSSSLDTCHSIEEQLLRYHWPRGQSSGHLLPRHWPRGSSGHICYIVVEHVSFNRTVVELSLAAWPVEWQQLPQHLSKTRYSCSRHATCKVT
jgi:hypothetical protein